MCGKEGGTGLCQRRNPRTRPTAIGLSDTAGGGVGRTAQIGRLILTLDFGKGIGPVQGLVYELLGGLSSQVTHRPVPPQSVPARQLGVSMVASSGGVSGSRRTKPD